MNNFCFHPYAQKSLSHSHALTITHSLSLSLSNSFNLSFNHSRYAQQVLFSSLCSKVAVYSRKLQWIFFDHTHSTLPCYFRCHRAGSQLKIHFQKCRISFGWEWLPFTQFDVFYDLCKVWCCYDNVKMFYISCIYATLLTEPALKYTESESENIVVSSPQILALFSNSPSLYYTMVKM